MYYLVDEWPSKCWPVLGRVVSSHRDLARAVEAGGRLDRDASALGGRASWRVVSSPRALDAGQIVAAASGMAALVTDNNGGGWREVELTPEP